MNPRNSSPVVRFTALQSVAEVGIGAVLHQFRVPLTGQILSLNQIFLMSWTTHEIRKSAGRWETAKALIQIAFLCAGLKTFAPIGKRLTPMLAISSQGLLFSSGIIVFGANLIGVLAGAALSSVWAFAQPLLIAWILMGETFFSAVEALWLDLSSRLGIDPKWGLMILFVAVLSKILAALLASALIWLRSKEVSRVYNEWSNSWARVGSAQSPIHAGPFKGALRDFLRPWFLVPSLLSIGFFWKSGEPTDLKLFFYTARVLVGGYLLFVMVRAVQFEGLRKRLQKSQILAGVLDELNRQRSRTSKS